MQFDHSGALNNNRGERANLQPAHDDQLRQALDPAISTYVLIDPLVGEPFPEIGRAQTDNELHALREQVWGREVFRIELSKSIQLPARQHPYLVRLKNEEDHLIKVSLEIAHSERLAAQADGLNGEGKAPHRISGWLQSDIKAVELAEIIALMCRVKTAAHTKATYLRIVDRRVLGLLAHITGIERTTRQFGKLQSWIFLNPLGRLTHLHNGNEQAALCLTVSEWRRMELGEKLHRTLAHWLGALADANNFSVESMERIYRLLEEVIVEASTAMRKWPHRFKSINDETSMAALLLIFPNALQSHSVKNLLGHTASAEMPPETIRYMVEELRKEFVSC